MIKAALNEVSATKADTTNFVLDGFVNKAAQQQLYVLRRHSEDEASTLFTKKQIVTQIRQILR